MSGSRWVTTPLWLSRSLSSLLCSSSVSSFHLFLISFASIRSLWFLSFVLPIFGWTVSLIFLIFLMRSLVLPFLNFFPLFLFVVKWRRASCLSLLFSGTPHSVGCTFPFLPCFSLLFFPLLFVKPPQTTTFPSYITFSLGWFYSLPCIILWTSVHSSSGTLFTTSNPLNIFIISTVYS